MTLTEEEYFLSVFRDKVRNLYGRTVPDTVTSISWKNKEELLLYTEVYSELRWKQDLSDYSREIVTDIKDLLVKIESEIVKKILRGDTRDFGKKTQPYTTIELPKPDCCTYCQKTTISFGEKFCEPCKKRIESVLARKKVTE